MPAESRFRESAVELLKEHRKIVIDARELTTEHWEMALDARREHAKEVEGARTRRAKAEQFLRASCASGDLVAATKSVTGEFWKVEKERWNKDNALEWLRTGVADSAELHPSPFGSSSHETKFLFLQKVELTALSNGGGMTSSPKMTEYSSPYMLLMRDVIREFGINANNPSKVDVIQPFIDAQWANRRLPPSKKLRTAMATMVREPAAQKGRAAKKMSVGVHPKNVYNSTIYKLDHPIGHPSGSRV